MGRSCDYCHGGMYEDHKTCNDIMDARESNDKLSARVEELEARIGEMRPFLSHKPDCPAATRGPCECGLCDLKERLDSQV